MTETQPPPAPHDVEWTPEKVGRFWGWMSEWTSGQPFFSQEYGGEVIRFAAGLVDLAGSRVLDSGAGPGHLIEQLLERGAECAGAELSETAVDLANERLGDRPGFLGVRRSSLDDLPFEDASFDVVFALEVIEHLLDDQVDPFFAETARVLRPGGLLIVSTPYAEDLRGGQALCPDCGAIFHRMQHVQGWTEATLPAHAERHGFVTAAVEATLLDLRTRRERALVKLKHALRYGARREPVNLLYAGRKAPEVAIQA